VAAWKKRQKKIKIIVYGNVIIESIEDINNIGPIKRVISKLNIKYDLNVYIQINIINR